MHPLNNPFLEHLGVELVEWREGHARMRLPLAAHHGNRTGRVQGGGVCTLLDGVAGYSGLYVEPGEPALEAVTLGLTTHFIASGDGTAAIATGRITSRGRRIFFAEAQVALDSGLVVATAMGNFRYVSARG